MVRPVTVIGLDDPVAVKLPEVEVTVYEVMAAPPLDEGAVNATDAEVPLATDVIGAPATKVMHPPTGTPATGVFRFHIKKNCVACDRKAEMKIKGQVMSS